MITRIVSALVLAPPLLYLILQGTPLHFFGLMLFVSAGLLYEWQGLTGGVVKSKWLVQTGWAWSLLTCSYLGVENYTLPLLLLSLLTMVSATVIYYQPNKPVIAQWSSQFAGLIYCTIPLILLLEIHKDWGGKFVLFPLLIIWATDSGAYFSGKFFGKKKLAPKLSPGKTWVGFYGGCISGLLMGLMINSLLSFNFSMLQSIIMGLLLSLTGQLGDLAESLLKREAGIKDSGNLILGHGGLLDRLDSLLFAAPVYYLLLIWVMHHIPPQGGLIAG
jgi:phosphatidate cytidylyltransferase